MNENQHEQDDSLWIRKHHQQVRWLKRFLKYVPRRSNIHRYPGLGWAGNMARKRMYLWSFRYREVAMALYVGCIISFLPIMGVQIPVALCFALFLRANLPVIVAVQFITNWLTAVPIYYVCFEVGRLILKLFHIHVETLGLDELREFIGNATNQNWGENGRMLLRVFLVTSLGGFIVGSFVGTLLDRLYSLFLWRAARIWGKMREIRDKRRVKLVATADNTPPPDSPATTPPVSAPHGEDDIRQ
ncbi:MAG TPA: DUF2062 domain-containing protein [Opitutales bacterium]|nr:DUF2062 domain-containing protein [Opitutales bacterium]